MPAVKGARDESDGDQDRDRFDCAEGVGFRPTPLRETLNSAEETEGSPALPGRAVGTKGGFGDRTIFNAAQLEIYEILRTDVYPKFVADVLARDRGSVPMPTSVGKSDGVHEAAVAPPSPERIKRLVKAVLAMKPP